MADEQPLNLESLEKLIALMDQHGLTEISVTQGDQQWTLKRGQTQAAVVPSVPAAADSEEPAESAESAGPTINSPTVGTFYAAPTPDDPPYVKVGQAVSPETIVCIVEAMKVFNQIPADVAGTIVEVLVENGDAVEFGKPLFRVQPG